MPDHIDHIQSINNRIVHHNDHRWMDAIDQSANDNHDNHHQDMMACSQGESVAEILCNRWCNLLVELILALCLSFSHRLDRELINAIKAVW